VQKNQEYPMLSIVTVCRNDAFRLEKTIESLNKFYNNLNFEHIVVDGESDDETDKVILSHLNDNNFRFYSEQDAGIYDAMNRGVIYSRAPLILFLNCGDTIIVTPDELVACLSRFMPNDGVLDLDIAIFPVQEVGVKGVRTSLPKILTRHKMPVSHQGMLFERRFIQLNKYQISYKIAGDFDLYLRASRIIIFNYKPFVRVELDGVASANPFTSYREYIIVAYKRINGSSKFISILLIGIRAIVVIFIKTLLPKTWIMVLRGYL